MAWGLILLEWVDECVLIGSVIVKLILTILVWKRYLAIYFTLFWWLPQNIMRLKSCCSYLFLDWIDENRMVLFILWVENIAWNIQTVRILRNVEYVFIFNWKIPWAVQYISTVWSISDAFWLWWYARFILTNDIAIAIAIFIC